MNFDLMLIIALVIELGRRAFKIRKNAAKLHRYRKNASNKVIDIIIISFVLVSIILYTINLIDSWQTGNTNTNQIFLIMVIYMGLNEIFISGIYYDGKAIYVNHYFIAYKDAKHIYRYLEDKYYVFDIEFYDRKYKMDTTTSFSIKNEMHAFPLLNAIPFEEIEIND